MNCPKCGASKDLKLSGVTAYFDCYSRQAADGELAQSDKCRIRELEAEVKTYKGLFDRALACVDDVFQEYTGHVPMLPDFLMAGDDKFEGVKKLAKAYITLVSESTSR